MKDDRYGCLFVSDLNRTSLEEFRVKVGSNQKIMTLVLEQITRPPPSHSIRV